MNTLPIGLSFCFSMVLCFGVTYFLSASKTTENFRAARQGKCLNNPILIGGGTGALLSLLFINPTPQYLILNAVVGVMIGWGVQAIKDLN